ncbi:MAG: ArsR/SmtB family transcription factor [Humibacter sp.]
MAISSPGKYDEAIPSVDGIGAVFAALADGTRLRIVEVLHDHESTVGALADELGLGAPTVSKHLTVLERAGLVARQRDAQRRVCRLEPAGFTSLAEWSRRYERFWAGSLDGLDDYLTTLDAEAAR